MKKLLTILTLLVCVVLQAWADERPLQLWPEISYSLTWEEYCIKDIFSNVTTGAELSFTYTSNSGSPQLQVWHKDGSYNGTQMSVTTTESSTFKVTISTDTELENIKARGIYIKGQDATITQISYTPNGGNPTTLWPETSYAISWSERTLLTSTMSSLSTGDGLRVTFTKSADSPQMQLQHKNESWSATDLFNDNITEPSYTVILSETAVADIKARGLTMKGQNATVTKIEAVALYTLTVTSSNEEYGIVTVETTALSESKYVSGTEVSVKAEAKAGYRFVNWTDNNNSDAAVSTDATYTFSISANTSLKANFEAESTHTDKPEVNVSAFSAMTSENNTPNFSAGTLTTTAAWTGIQQWIGDNSGVQGSQLVVKTESACKLKIDVYYTDNTQRSLTVPETAISTFVLALEKTKYIKSIQIQNSEVGIVKFTCIALDPLYTITATSADTDKGTAVVKTDPTSAGKYAYGTSVTVTATPVSGYSFSQWKVGETSVSTDASYTFTATEDVALTAEFAVGKTTQALKNATQKMVNETVGTKVLISNSAFANVTDGDIITVNMSEVATSGAFIVLKENTSGTSFFGNNYSSALTSGQTSFTHTLTASDITLLTGDNKALCITGEGFTCGNITITSAGSITADAAHTTMYVLSVAQPASGGTIQIGSSDAAAQKAYDNGSQVTLTAVPSNGYIFSKWTKDGSEAGSAESLNVTFNGADITVTAEFITNPRILTGSNEFSTGNSLFSSLALGDKIRVNFSKTDENDAEYTPSIEVRLTSGDTNSKLSGNFNSSTDAEKTLYEIKVTEESAVTSIKSNGLFIAGNDITIGEISVIPAKQLTWFNEYEIPASEFSTIEVGGKINLTFTRSTNPYLQIVCPTTDSWTYLDGVSLAADTYSYDVTEDNCEPIKTKGLRLKGQDLTYSSVSVEAASPSSSEKTLSQMETIMGSWTGYVTIDKAKFANAAVNDVLKIYTKDKEDGAQISLKDQSTDWPALEVATQYPDLTDDVFSYTIPNETVLGKLKDYGLVIGGQKFTYVKATLTTAEDVPELVQYTLTTTATNGSISSVPKGTDGKFDAGYTVKLTATPNDGYQFSKWTDGTNDLVANEDKSLSVTMDANKSITAIFEAAADTRTEQPINMTENVIGNWNNFTIKKEKFNNVASTGDVIKIYVKDVKEDAQISLKIPTGNWDEFKGFNPTTTDTEFSYTITSEVLAQLKEYGLAVSGKNYTSVKLTLKTNGTVPIENYALTYAASPEIGGTVAVTKKVGDASENIASGTTVAEFTELTATVTANEGFTFKNWQVNGQDKTNQTSTTYKFVMDKDASLLAVFNPPTFEYELTLWEDSKAITWDEWSTGNSNENFSQVKKNDMIRITFTKSDDSPQMQIWQKDADWNGTQIYGGDVEEPSYAFFVANDAMATNIMERGLYIKGQNATITKIELLTNSVVTDSRTEKTLVEKTQAISDGDIEINRGLFSNAVAGDIIRIYAKDLSATSKIALATDYDSAFDGANWTGFTESPFSLKLTASLLSKVQEKNLLIRGENYTFTKAVLYTEKELGEAIGSGGEEPEISNTDASEETKKLFNVLKDLYGKKIVSGVVANVDWNTKEAENVYNWTGKWPALNVYDFINLHASKDVNSAGWVDYSDITTAKNWWKEGGIVGAMWHWQVKANNGTDYTCTPGTAANETSFDASKVYVDGTSENTLAKQQLDQLCGYLKKMQDAGIPVVWRPLHEGSGNVEQYAGGKAWFWWGAKGADVYKQLWQWMYNYMVKTKGLNNLIWVWTSQTKDNNWYPGDAYVDIIGRDNYGATAATLATEYEALKDTHSNKMMTLSECGNSETAEMAKLSSIWDAGSRWSWFMTWYDGDYNDGTSTTHKHAGKTWWDDAMAKDYVVTRDQMKELLGQDSGGGSQTGVNISLDDLNEGWSSTYDATTKTITTTGEWAARGWYIGDDRYSQKGSITVKYEAVQFGVTLKMEYTNTNGDSKSVSAGAAAGETEVELDIPADVKTIEKVYITYQPIGTLKLTAVSVNDKVVDNRTEKTLVETSQAISDGDIKINRGLFSNAVAKDVLYIYATGLSDASKIALEPADYSGALDGAQWTAFTESPFTLKLTESALATIKEKGLLVRGENFTFTKATLYTESELGSIIPDEEEPSIDPEVPSTNEPVINEGGKVKLDEVKAQDETTTVTYNKEEETLTITTTEPYKAAQIWLNEPEEVTNEVLKVEIAESNANVIVTVGYTDGTETSAASSAATAASRTLRALSRGATEETGTVVTVPLSAGKEIQKIEIKNVEPGTITITSMSVTTLINEGETVTLWSSNEGETLTWNDIARQTTDLTNLLKEYDELLITVSARAEGNDWPKVFLRDINYESVGRETLLNEVTTFPYIVRYVLTSELLEKIKNGFSVCGDGVTITKVELYRPVPPKEGDIHLRSLDYGYGSSYDASITTMTTTTRWAARGWEIGDMRYNSKDLVIIGYEAVDFPVTIKMEYVDDKGQKQATSTGVAAGQNYVQMAIPEGITQLDRVYLTYQNPGSLKLTEASVVTTGKARSRGFINDGVTTGIKDVKRGADMSDKWYDMNGRQVKQPSKGLYIKNGKKIMHK